MPYNPGSAYPRKTVYVPPTYGDHSFQRAVNSPDFTSRNTAGGGPWKPRGRGMFAEVAGQARGAATSADAATGFEAMNRQGIVGKESQNFTNRLNSKRGGQRSVSAGDDTEQVTSAADLLPRGNFDMGTVDPAQAQGLRHTSTHGNTAATAKRQSAVELSDQAVMNVLTGTMPGFTGTANIPKK